MSTPETEAAVRLGAENAPTFRQILIWPDPMLSRVCEPVTDFGPELQKLLADMGETMRAASGAGLAAPQVGFALRAIVLKVKTKGEFEVLKLVNPVITERRGSVLKREGCLSLPGFFEMVRRSEWVRCEAQDETGAKVVLEGDGLLAHALEHECEHLDGQIFVEKLSPLKRERARATFRKAKARGMKYVSTPGVAPS
jgi:peptide deformylase